MSFARQAANAHLVFAPDLRHPVEFGADQQDSLLLWLSERLGAAVHAPLLQDAGFNLVGGRLLPASGKPAAQLMYEDPAASGSRCTSAAAGTRPSAGQPEGSVSYWTEDQVAWSTGSRERSPMR